MNSIDISTIIYSNKFKQPISIYFLLIDTSKGCKSNQTLTFVKPDLLRSLTTCLTKGSGRPGTSKELKIPVHADVVNVRIQFLLPNIKATIVDTLCLPALSALTFLLLWSLPEKCDWVFSVMGKYYLNPLMLLIQHFK